MTLDKIFVPVRNTIYEMVGNLFKKIAGFFGYPENPGMPFIYKSPDEVYASIPKHRTYWPPLQSPETLFELIFGPAPKVDIVPRYVYETKEEGFYNFYIENYQNIFFLPDWLSEFIQVRLNICLDLTVLEILREGVFIVLMVCWQMLLVRIAISWFLSINPYSFPWFYISAIVDWTEELLQGFVPTMLGINVTGIISLGILGKLADSLNYLVFTMPFLPSEGEATKLLINKQMKDVLVFHYLPITWYRYPIPNNIRKFWYYERPDILEYMQKAYKELDIQFLPDNIIKELSKKGDLISQTNNITDYISTEILSKENLFHSDTILNSINFFNENFQNVSFIHNNHLF
jgi:uncharacterized protein YggT (Ycf19 family)